MGRKRRKVWLWLALERASRRIVAWVLGTPGTATCRRLWAALPARYRCHCWYHTDEWPAYAAVLPLYAYRRDEAGQTNVVEALNCSLRQRYGVLVRKF
ncbi:IS1 family transposase [Hymenobacter arcticus]